jgi:hypothetical protein
MFLGWNVETGPDPDVDAIKPEMLIRLQPNLVLLIFQLKFPNKSTANKKILHKA